MTWLDWYNSLAKPMWTPAPSTISLIWMILYPVILISFGFVFVQAFWGKVPWRIAMPFAVNLVANLLFMPIFSGLRNVPLAAVDIVIVWTTILCCMIVVWPVYRWVLDFSSCHFNLCFWKNSHIRSLAERFLADLPMKPTGGC